MYILFNDDQNKQTKTLTSNITSGNKKIIQLINLI